MKTLDIFYTLFIISVIVNKTMITFPNTLNYSFTEKNYIVLRGGGAFPTGMQMNYGHRMRLK